MTTSTETAQIQKILQAAADEISAKFGLEKIRFDVRRFRGDNGIRIMAQNMAPASKVPVMQLKTTAITGSVTPVLANAMTLYGIKSNKNDKGDVLTDYKASRPKYPFVYTSARGTAWKITAEQARQRFGRATNV